MHENLIFIFHIRSKHLKEMYRWLTSCMWNFFIPSENIRKPEGFYIFSGGIERNQ